MADQDFNIKVVTTANLSGIQQTSAGFKQLEQQQQAAGQAAANVGRIIGASLAGIPAAMLLDLKHVTDEVNRATKEFDKQGDRLIDLAQKYHDLARAATTPDDVRQIANQAIPAIKAAQDKVNEANSTQLNLYERIIDSVYHLGQNVLAYGQASEDSGKIHKQALDLASNGAERLLALSEQLARGAIKEGEAFQEAFERRKTEPFEQALKEINDEISKLRNQQKELLKDPFFNPAEYSKAANAISALTQQARALTKAHNESAKAAADSARAVEKAASDKRQFEQSAFESASPQAKAILANEEAARRTGDQLFQKSADAFKRGATPEALGEYEALEAARTAPERAAAAAQAKADQEQYMRDQFAPDSGIASLIGKDAAEARQQEQAAARSEGRIGTADPMLRDILTELQKQTDLWR